MYAMYDIAIIGAGPGGYVAAIRAAQLGAKVVLIEKEAVGGVCLNWGCIPSKAIISCADKYNEAKKLSKYGIKAENVTFNYREVFDRKQQIVEKLQKSLTRLIKSKNVELVKGEAVIETNNSLKVNGEIIEFKNLIIATGSRTKSLPGLEIDHKYILDSNDILSLQELPDSVLIVGSGAVGLEWARVFHSFEKQVTIVEIADRLCPMFDREVSEYIEKLKKRKRIAVYKNTTVDKLDIKPDIIFLAAGRQPNTKDGKFIKVDNNLRTNISNIYAIGDVTGIFPLAHVASHQGVKAVEHILLGKEVNINYNHVPFVVYGKPEIASVGYTEEALITKEIPYKKSVFPISAVGRAQTDDKTEGFVKILANDKEILGVHIVAEYAGELIQQATIAMSNGLSPENLIETIFPHPTYSEAIHEGFLGIFGEFLHI
ncbi:MAG: dihydrolipoyl dehydrogenase [Candidatus Melainabacteria bacterium GWF2_37_15]|nr:MAG: dihydrolipoyl dehydrogenase [Candidatus Melainabacteria bacterium GWF2_37_15]